MAEFNDRRPKTFTVNYSDKPMTYTNRCSSCFAQPGQPCRTKKGRPAAKMHNGRSIGPA